MAADASDYDAADAAADRALARDPKSAQALLYKGIVALRRAQKAKAPAAAWIAARKYVIQANKLDPDNALPLVIFYQSFRMEDRAPTANAVAGLLRAQELAPQDPGLRFLTVTQSIRDGELDRARRLLKPLAYSPHGGGEDSVGQLLAALEATKDPKVAQAALAEAMKREKADLGS